MIPLRNHLVSLAAVFLALAVGIILGSTSISERVLTSVTFERDSMSARMDVLRDERDSLRTEVDSAKRFGDAVGPLAVRGQLDQRTVVLMSTWQVTDQERASMRGLLAAAGASVRGEVRIAEGVTDPGRADQLRSLATELLPTGTQLPVAADPGTLAGGLLAALTLLDPVSGHPRGAEQERLAALRGLADGGFAHANKELRPAELAVVLTGGEVSERHPGDRAATLARLAAHVDGASAGAVLAGRSGSAGGKGPVGSVRADAAIAHSLSTVDNTDQMAGRVAVVLGLREQWERESGHYGSAASAQGEIPNSRG